MKVSVHLVVLFECETVTVGFDSSFFGVTLLVGACLANVNFFNATIFALNLDGRGVLKDVKAYDLSKDKITIKCPLDIATGLRQGG